MAWVLAGQLAALRHDLNTAFPNRDHESDGTIGDDDHKTRPSGHNPDDTAGALPESNDADTKQEVRAFDADEDLRAPGVSMMQVVKKILATPNDLKRLAYIIYERTIWRKKGNWRPEAYDGDNPHDKHVHFSGDPLFDEDTAPWTSILSFMKETDVDTTPADVNDWTGLRRIESIHKNLDATVVDSAGGGEPNKLKLALASIQSQANSNGSGISELKVAVATLIAGGVTQEMVNAAVKSALLDPDVLAGLANAINDDAARRLAD